MNKIKSQNKLDENSEEEEDYNISPNFEYEEDIIDDAEITYALIDSFEAFMSKKDNKPYLIYQNKGNQKLEVLKVLKNKYKLVESIEGHKTKITSIKYFFNEYENIEYLISSDYDGKILITNITEDFKRQCLVKTTYNNGQITCCLMIFRLIENIDFDIKKGIILMANKNLQNQENQNCHTKVYILGENGDMSFYKNLNGNNLYNTSYILHWKNKKNNRDYIIDIGNRKVEVIGLTKNDLYFEFRTSLETWYHCGYIFCDKKKDRDLLFITTIKSYLFVFDLNYKQTIKSIKTSQQTERLYGILPWNYNYILIAGATSSDIKIIDINQIKYVGNIFIGHEDDFRCIKKINHPKFGYCIMTGCDDSSIKLFKPKDI